MTRPRAFDPAAGAAYQMFQEMTTTPRKRRSTAAKKDRETDRRQERQARLERQRQRDVARRCE